MAQEAVEDEGERPTAMAAFGCATTGALFGLIPGMGAVALFLGLVGLIMGVSGWRRKPEPAKLARAAALLGALAAVLGVVGALIVSDVFGDSDDPVPLIEPE